MAPQLTVRKNGGAAQTGAITCAYSDSIRIRLASPGSVRSCRFEIYGYPSGWSAPSGWTEDTEARVIYATTTEPSDFTLPASATWGKWLLRAIVDGETDDGVTALEIVSSAGIHATPAGESTQFGGAAQSWGRDLEANWRTLETALAGAGASLAGDVTGLAGANTVERILNTPVDLDGDPEPGDCRVMTARSVSGSMSLRFELPRTPRVFFDAGATATAPYNGLPFPLTNSWSDAVAQATSIADQVGHCELVVLDNAGASTAIPSGTWDLGGNVDVVGFSRIGGRVTLSLAAGVAFRNGRTFRNLTIENDQAEPLFETVLGGTYALRFEDCDLSDVGMTAYWSTMPSGSSGTVTMVRTTQSGLAFIDLGTTLSLIVTLHDSRVYVMAIGDPGSSLYVFAKGNSYYRADGAFAGSLTETWTAGGSKTVDVAGTGSVTLSENQCAADELIFTGALTGAKTVVLSDEVRRRTIWNKTTGAYPLRIECSGGGFTYLLPSQSRVVTVDTDGFLHGEALSVMETAITVLFAGDTVGNHATFLCALPAGCIVDRCEVYTLTSTSGGTSKVSVGQNSSTYDDILAQATTPSAGSEPLGKASSTLGSAMSTDGCAFYNSATALYLNHNVTSATVTAGSVRVFVAARYLGV